MPIDPDRSPGGARDGRTGRVAPGPWSGRAAPGGGEGGAPTACLGSAHFWFTAGVGGPTPARGGSSQCGHIQYQGCAPDCWGCCGEGRGSRVLSPPAGLLSLPGARREAEPGCRWDWTGAARCPGPGTRAPTPARHAPDRRGDRPGSSTSALAGTGEWAVPQGGPGAPISRGPQPGPLPSSCNKQSPGIREDLGPRGAGRSSPVGSRQVGSRGGGSEPGGRAGRCAAVPRAGARAPAAGPAGNCSAPGSRAALPARSGGGRGIGGPGLPHLGRPAAARRLGACRSSLVPARAWAELSGRGPGPRQVRAPPLQAASQPCSLRYPAQTPPAPLHEAGSSRAGGHADLPEVGWRVREEGAPPLTSAVGVEEAQGDQGARHQDQQQEQRPLQEASVLLPRVACDLHGPHWVLGLPHHKSLDRESAPLRCPRPRAGAVSTQGGAPGQGGRAAPEAQPEASGQQVSGMSGAWPPLHPKSTAAVSSGASSSLGGRQRASGCWGWDRLCLQALVAVHSRVGPFQACSLVGVVQGH